MAVVGLVVCGLACTIVSSVRGVAAADAGSARTHRSTVKLAVKSAMCV